MDSFAEKEVQYSFVTYGATRRVGALAIRIVPVSSAWALIRWRRSEGSNLISRGPYSLVQALTRDPRITIPKKLVLKVGYLVTIMLRYVQWSLSKNGRETLELLFS